MSSRRALVSIFLLVMVGQLSASPLAVQPGERFVYRLAWGPVRKAGSLEIIAERAPDAPETLTRITTHTATRGLIRALYRFDGWGEFFYEAESGNLLKAEAWTETAKKKTSATMTLDYDAMTASYVDHLRPHRSLDLPIPEVQAMDFLTTLMQTRNWDIDVGDAVVVPVYFDDELYELEITAEEITTVPTPWGRRPALLLIPRMPVHPRGMFEDGGEIRVWVSHDELRLPLRFEVKVPVGTAMAVLTAHETNTTQAAATRPTTAN